MSEYKYTEEMVARMSEVFAGGVTEDKIQSLVEEFGYPRRSVTAKARKLKFDVPTKPKDAPAFSEEETSALVSFLESNSGTYTAEEIAETFAEGKFTARQIGGKALSLEMTAHIRPAEKKVTPKTFTEEQEARIVELVNSGAFLEDIAADLGKEVASVRGKLLSMQLKAPQKVKKESKSESYPELEALAPTMTVEELAEHYGKSARGVKTAISRRKIQGKDWPVTKSAE